MRKDCDRSGMLRSCMLKWHYRLGHLNVRDLARSIRDCISSNINLKDIDKLSH